MNLFNFVNLLFINYFFITFIYFCSFLIFFYFHFHVMFCFISFIFLLINIVINQNIFLNFKFFLILFFCYHCCGFYYLSFCQYLLILYNRFTKLISNFISFVVCIALNFLFFFLVYNILEFY